MNNHTGVNVSDTEESLTRLTNTKLSLSEILAKDGTTFEVNFDDFKDEAEEQYSYNTSNVFEFSNPDCIGLVDEDTYQDTEPFEGLAKKMTDIIENGGVKKRILRPGIGEVVPDRSVVTVEYNAYLEYNDEPFDSTYLRKKPFTFRVNDGQTLPGLDIAVQTMKLQEKSQFLIHPDYAYGRLGCMARVPPNSMILYEVEIKNCVNSGAAISYQELPEAEQKDFAEIYKYAHALCSKGNDLYGKNMFKQAIKEYNIAASKLEFCQLKDYNDQEKQQQLLLRLRTNLVVAHTKLHEPRRACTNCNKIYYMCKGTGLKIPTKVYFNHARSLMLLNDYVWAERQLKQALRLEPQNKEIAREFIILDAKRKESNEREKALAKAIFRNTKQEPEKVNKISKQFEDSITQFCKNLLHDKESMQYKLPDNLTECELEFSKKEALKHGLELKPSQVEDVDTFFIVKPSDADHNK